MNNFQTILRIREQIRAFTQAKPSDGICNPDYRAYMANCSTLFEFDVQLSDIENQDLPEEEVAEMLSDIEKNVDFIVSKYIQPIPTKTSSESLEI